MKMNELAKTTRAESDSRIGSMLTVSGVFFVAVILVFSTTDAIPIGVDEGEMPPNIKGESHVAEAGNVWNDFDLYSLFQSNWTEGDYNSTWFVVEFMSTDCPVCMSFSDEIEELSEYWFGRVQFIAVAVDFQFSDEFTSTPEEIIAFQEKKDFEGCNHGKGNCNTRDGGPHTKVLYVDDRDASSMDDWGVQGTPTSYILSPNGVVAWNQRNHAGQDLIEALMEIVPTDGMEGGA